MMTTLMITLCFTAVLAADSILGATSESEKNFEKMKKGGNLTMECNTKDNKKDNFSLYARLPSKHVVMVCDKHTNSCNPNKSYSERVKSNGNMHKLTIRISDLQLSDSGLYLGLYSKFVLEKNAEEEEEGCSLLLFVNDVDERSVPEISHETSLMSEPLVLVFALTACTMLVVCFLVMWVFAPKVKALCVNQADDASREYNPVYEDMHRVQNK